MTHKKEKSEKFRVLKCWMFSFEAWSRLLYLECLSWRPRNRYIPIYKLKHKRFFLFQFKKNFDDTGSKDVVNVVYQVHYHYIMCGLFLQMFSSIFRYVLRSALLTPPWM